MDHKTLGSTYYTTIKRMKLHFLSWAKVSTAFFELVHAVYIVQYFSFNSLLYTLVCKVHTVIDTYLIHTPTQKKVLGDTSRWQLLPPPDIRKGDQKVIFYCTWENI